MQNQTESLPLRERLDKAEQSLRSGRIPQAEALCRAILADDCGNAAAQHLLGIIAHQQGRGGAAAAAFHRAVRCRPDYAVAHYNLGVELAENRQAAARFTIAVCLKPDFAKAYYNLGNERMEAGAAAPAAVAFGCAARLEPDFADALRNWGAALDGMKRREPAMRALKHAICRAPDYAEAYSNLGKLHSDAKRLEAAIAIWATALRIAPDLFEPLHNLGGSLREPGRLAAGLAAGRAALCLRPDYAESWTNLGNRWLDLGEPDRALAAYRRAIKAKPDFADGYSCLLANLHYGSAAPAGEDFDLARRFAALLESEAVRPYANAPEPDRRLRVGYVSGDFRRHPVGYFLIGSLAAHDRSNFEIHCYRSGGASDDMTERLRGLAQGWRDIGELSDEDAATLIRQDGIDILVDLSGHTELGRLGIFARKPAPVQVSWLGFWGTTGLSRMDWCLTDDITVLPEEDAFYSERVWRLPGSRFCYSPPDYAPAPSRRSRTVTFGSFNNLAKIGDQVVRVWARILRAVPESRLLLKWKSLDDPLVRNRVSGAFAAEGIHADRLILRGVSAHIAMLDEYGDMDIALDPFPFGGGLTSCEALWMGVPLVTWPNFAAASRQTLGFLRPIGCEEWAASSEDDYVRIAAELAGDPARLDLLRQTLRHRMAASALCDAGGFTHGLEQAYRGMWRIWCGEQGVAALAAGDSAAAARLFRQALAADGLAAHFHSNLGVALTNLEQKREAEAAFLKALCVEPQFAQAYSNIAVNLTERRQLEAAESVCRRAVRLMPGHAEGHCNLGNVRKAMGALEAARSAYLAAIAVRPDFAEALSNLGAVEKELGRFDQSAQSCLRAIRLRPDGGEAYYNMSVALKDRGRLTPALAAARAAICLNPAFAEPYSVAGIVATDLGEFVAAAADYRRALAIAPDFATAHSNLILNLHYRPDFPRGEILAEARRFGERVERVRPRAHKRPRKAGKPLRVGYVSGDFHRHPVGFFLASVLAFHDPEAVESFCYSNGRRGDDMTALLRGHAAHWRGLAGIADEAAERMIVEDGIDILVDLSGHTSRNRLSLFARKPAPIQVSWLGFWGTTGLNRIDYVLSDEVTIPQSLEADYGEKIWRLPGLRFCYAPPSYAPLPRHQPGGVTFGSFNNAAKIGPQVIALWAELLRALPDSRLILKWLTLEDEGSRRRLLDQFAAAGVGAERVILRGHSPHAQMLAEYDEIDVALDPFPFSGGLTSCEALWMGVPVVTLPGESPVSRQTLGFLRAIGREEWVASSPRDYLRIATELAQAPQAREALRQRVAASPLCQGERFTREMEAAYREMWRR